MLFAAWIDKSEALEKEGIDEGRLRWNRGQQQLDSGAVFRQPEQPHGMEQGEAPLHFGLSVEQELLQETLRGLVAGECPPARLREILDGGSGFDEALWNQLSEMGLTALVIPEADDGAGLSIVDLALVAEVAGSCALPGPLLEHSLACLAIARSGTPAQRERWLPGLASGERFATIALGEEDGFFSPDEATARIEDATLRGSKIYVPHAERANVAVVTVAGGTLAVIDLDEAESQGTLERSAQDGIDRSRRIGGLRFDGCACDPVGNRETAEKLRDATLVTVAADAFGAATRLIELCVAYAKDRKQFGFPIAQFQAVKHQIARMGTEIEPTRALWWYAAHALDEALPDAERAAAMAKAHITEHAISAARVAVELHGGLGFTWECDVQIFFKRAMYDRSFLGTPEFWRERCATLAGW